MTVKSLESRAHALIQSQIRSMNYLGIVTDDDWRGVYRMIDAYMLVGLITPEDQLRYINEVAAARKEVG